MLFIFSLSSNLSLSSLECVLQKSSIKRNTQNRGKPSRARMKQMIIHTFRSNVRPAKAQQPDEKESEISGYQVSRQFFICSFQAPANNLFPHICGAGHRCVSVYFLMTHCDDLAWPYMLGHWQAFSRRSRLNLQFFVYYKILLFFMIWIFFSRFVVVFFFQVFLLSWVPSKKCFHA